MRSDNILIIGAGLVGSLLSIMLIKKGFSVSIFEKRPDPRLSRMQGGRSINLALSHRGITALKYAGVYDSINPKLIPMHGRKIHQQNGILDYQPYGKTGQFINSVSRKHLNELLVAEAEKLGVNIHFDHTLTKVDFDETYVELINHGQTFRVAGQCIIGADGANSMVREQFQKHPDFDFERDQLDYGYKELSVDPVRNDFALDPNALHIWPRGKFMLIALPNNDKSFTATLFLPLTGENSFECLKSIDDIKSFFSTHFEDSTGILNLNRDFLKNPISTLATIKCNPWNQHKTLLIGDASHGIVPFYGQGMNAGFESCRLLVDSLPDESPNWKTIFNGFQKTRKRDTDAIASFALKNFTEMSEWVGDKSFLLKKQIEAKLAELDSTAWVPEYSMVTFSDMPYSEAWRKAENQHNYLRKFLEEKNISDISRLDLGEFLFGINS